jgi:hypothetical protein
VNDTDFPAEEDWLFGRIQGELLPPISMFIKNNGGMIFKKKLTKVYGSHHFEMWLNEIHRMR